MDTLNKTLVFKNGQRLEIHHDPDPESPRNWDNLGTMVCFHKRYNLGDEMGGLNGHGYFEARFSSWEQLKEQIEEDHPNCIILALYLFDHSGLIISTDCSQFRACDSAGWDWGQVGFIFVSRETIKKEFEQDNGRTDEQIETYLRGEVETYSQYLSGDVWGFILRDTCEKCGQPDGEVDSCWGFYGDNPAENGMIDHFDKEIQEALRKDDFQEA